MTKATVMTLANMLHYRQGLTRSQALRTAWRMVRQAEFHSKLAGVTFSTRQTALLRLKKYAADMVTVVLVQENNPVDANAVAVKVSVVGSRPFKVGYLPRSIATVWSSLVARGMVKAQLERVAGGNGRSLGAVVKIKLVA